MDGVWDVTRFEKEFMPPGPTKLELYRIYEPTLGGNLAWDEKKKNFIDEELA